MSGNGREKMTKRVRVVRSVRNQGKLDLDRLAYALLLLARMQTEKSELEGDNGAATPASEPKR
jgi:hypothetical protein